MKKSLLNKSTVASILRSCNFDPNAPAMKTLQTVADEGYCVVDSIVTLQGKTQDYEKVIRLMTIAIAFRDQAK
jgi:hypothetical protein